MNHRVAFLSILGAIAAGLVAVSVAFSGLIPAAATGARGGLTVSDVAGNGLIPFAPMTFTRAQLAALTQVTDTVTIDGVSATESGPTVASLLAAAGQTYISACKNDELRYYILGNGSAGQATEFTAGEIDPGFGNNVAIVSIVRNGTALGSPQLVLPKDANGGRDITGLSSLMIGRAAPQLADTATPACTSDPSFSPTVATPPKGTVVVNGDVAHGLELTYANLGSYPQVTQTDTFLSGTKTSTNTETGPTLFDVVSAAEPKFLFCNPNDDQRFYVEITSSEDGYAAIVSYAEFSQYYNGNQMLLSLIENGKTTLTQDTDPRSTVPGDVHGGRYNFGAAVVTVLRADDGSGPNWNSLVGGGNGGTGLTLPQTS